MIPFEVALLAYIPVAALMMFDRNRARGFTATVLVGLMLLPVGRSFELPGVPDLDKGVVTFLGILIGTILFHPKSVDEFRIHPSDLLLVGTMQAAIFTAVIQHYGLRDGVVRALEFGLSVVLPILLARLHLGTPSALRTFLVGVVIAGCIAAPLAALEWRLSPKVHITLYGYFQHDFQQFMRNGAFRPVLCFDHALTLAQFFAFAAFLALFPLRRDLVGMFGGWARYICVIPLVGLVLSMSWGPQMLFVLLCFLYHAIQKQPWTAFVFPMLMFLWLIGLFAGFEFGMDVVKDVEDVNAERAQSLGYRFNAMVQYKEQILDKPWFGWGGHGRGRIENIATDSQAIITLLDRGWVGMFFIYSWYLSGVYIALKVSSLVPGTALDRRVRAIGALIALWVSISIIDGALETYGICLLAGVMATRTWLETKNVDESVSASSALGRALPMADNPARQKG